MYAPFQFRLHARCHVPEEQNRALKVIKSSKQTISTAPLPYTTEPTQTRSNAKFLFQNTAVKLVAV